MRVTVTTAGSNAGTTRVTPIGHGGEGDLHARIGRKGVRGIEHDGAVLVIAARVAVGEAQCALAQRVGQRAADAADELLGVVRQSDAGRNGSGAVAGGQTGAVERHPSSRRTAAGEVVGDGDLCPCASGAKKAAQRNHPCRRVSISFHQQPPKAPRLHTPLVT